MRNTISFSMFLAMLICVVTSCHNLNVNIGAGNSHQILLTKGSYPASEIKQVVATTSGGNIEVVGDATDDATLEVYGAYRSSDSATIVAKVDEYFNLKISHDNNTLNVTAERKSSINGMFSNNNGIAVHFRIHVNKEVATNLKTSGGNLHLAQLTGNQHIHTSGGNINAEDIQGAIAGETSGGNIHLQNIGQDIDLHTSGGNIDGNNINGTTKLETSGGNITISDGKGSYALETSGGNVTAANLSGPINMHTSGGNIAATNISGGIIGSTSGGGIHVQLVNVNSDIDLDNSGGDVNINIPKTSKVNLAIGSENVSVNGLVNFSGKSDKHSIEGTLNGGGPAIKAKTSGGTVHLNLE